MNETDLDKQIDLKEVFTTFWESKFFILLLTTFFALTSVLYSLSLQNYFQSQSVLSVASSSNQNSMSGYSGLASIAGISLPNQGEDKGIIIIETIESREFLKHLLTFDNVLPSIMAPESYDVLSRKLTFDKDKYEIDSDSWVRNYNKGQQAKPSYLETHKIYKEQVSISKDKSSGLIYLSVEHISPVFAKEFSDLIIREANVLLRERDLKISTEALSFLKSEISKTSLVSIKESINQLIQNQLEKQMMAKVNEDYALMTIEPPFVPELKAGPSRALICIVGTILGFVLSLIIVIVRKSFFT